ERVGDAIRYLGQFDSAAQRYIRDVLETIASGQELDLQRFAYGSADCIIPLRSDEELEDYTYRVAGCVGEFWTRICQARPFASSAVDNSGWIANGIRFGKGLQLINILRDLPQDLRRGRCYLPLARLSEFELAPVDLLKPEAEEAIRPLYD